MPYLFGYINGGEMIGLVAVAGGLSIAIISIFGYHWRRLRESELLAGLKQEMLERGMSANEIEQVICATPENAPDIQQINSYCDRR